MSINYQYIYAEIDLDTNECIAVFSSSTTSSAPCLVELEVKDPEYIGKYYNWNDGKFYYDSAYTQEYISPLL